MVNKATGSNFIKFFVLVEKKNWVSELENASQILKQ